MGSPAHRASRRKIPDVSPAPHSTKFGYRAPEIRLPLSPRLISAARVGFNGNQVGALNMSVCYLRDDNDVDAERCRISLREKSPITLLTVDSAGRVSWWTGVVQSMRFDPNRAVGRRWRIEMDLATVASTGLARKARQRSP
jgi:hypothetical protein